MVIDKFENVLLVTFTKLKIDGLIEAYMGVYGRLKSNITFSIELAGLSSIEASIKDFSVQSYEDYERGFEQYYNNIKKKEKLINSWWYKYLYIPYYKIINKIFGFLSYLLNKLIRILVRIFYFITPIDPV